MGRLRPNVRHANSEVTELARAFLVLKLSMALSPFHLTMSSLLPFSSIIWWNTFCLPVLWTYSFFCRKIRYKIHIFPRQNMESGPQNSDSADSGVCDSVMQLSWLHPHPLVSEDGAVNEGAKDYTVVVRWAGGTTWHLQGPRQAQGKFWNAKWFCSFTWHGKTSVRQHFSLRIQN